MSKLPQHIIDNLSGGLERWVKHAIQPGGFLMAVLRGDVLDAKRRADSENVKHLLEIFEHVQSVVPAAARGVHIKTWRGTK